MNDANETSDGDGATTENVMDEFFQALIGYFLGSLIGEWLFGDDEEDDKRKKD